MEKRINTGLQLNERAEIRHTGNPSRYHIACCVLLSGVSPRIGLRELHGKSDLLAVNILNQGCYLVANLEYLLRALNSAPGHFGNMKQSVSSAQINKCSEIRYIFNGSFHSLANSDSLKEGFLHLSLSGND